ncbi:hypothetical protein [Rhodoblastus sp.]|uniref:hypothetical protein n=1 Tax=Rhodoblastus sp. TaxID=1962975 RepID=UPI003F964705
MRQFSKFGVFAALGALLAPAAPAVAGAHVCAGPGRPHHVHHIHVRSVTSVRSRIDNGAYGYVGGYPSATPYSDDASGPYPVGYEGSSWSPTGYGVVYNVPPAPYLPPRIIYVYRHPDFPQENGVTVVRGGAVSADY